MDDVTSVAFMEFVGTEAEDCGCPSRFILKRASKAMRN